MRIIGAIVFLAAADVVAEPTAPAMRVYDGAREVCSRDRHGKWTAVDGDWPRCVAAIWKQSQEQLKLLGKLVMSVGVRR